MKVLFLAGREIGYARNEVLLRAFRRFSDVDVVADERVPRFLPARSLQVALKAHARLRQRRYDLVFVGFYGHLILPLVASAVHSPLLFDAFVSNYDTLCFDRQQFAPDSWPGRLAYRLDRTNCRLATHVLLDTERHIDYFVETFDLPPAAFTALPVGCSDEIFAPRPQRSAAGATVVLGYSTFLPLHGMEVILEAAARLAGERLRFRLVGDGPRLAACRTLADRLRLDNVHFSPPMAPLDLANEIAAADLCLGGHFGSNAKAGRVIPGKVYQMLAVGRAVIAGDTPGNRELLEHRRTAYLVPPADPDALTEAIRCLHRSRELRCKLADAGRTLYAERCSEAAITRQLAAAVKDLTGRRS